MRILTDTGIERTRKIWDEVYQGMLSRQPSSQKRKWFKSKHYTTRHKLFYRFIQSQTKHEETIIVDALRARVEIINLTPQFYHKQCSDCMSFLFSGRIRVSSQRVMIFYGGYA